MPKGLGHQATTSSRFVPTTITVVEAQGSINVHTIYLLVKDKILTLYVRGISPLNSAG
jgi:hypothetical protein